MGISSGKPTVVANFTNPEEFFSELEKYFSELRPLERLNNIERLTESYKKTLLENFSLEEIIGEISSVRRHSNWAKE